MRTFLNRSRINLLAMVCAMVFAPSHIDCAALGQAREAGAATVLMMEANAIVGTPLRLVEALVDGMAAAKEQDDAEV